MKDTKQNKTVWSTEAFADFYCWYLTFYVYQIIFLKSFTLYLYFIYNIWDELRNVSSVIFFWKYSGLFYIFKFASSNHLYTFILYIIFKYLCAPLWSCLTFAASGCEYCERVTNLSVCSRIIRECCACDKKQLACESCPKKNTHKIFNANIYARS